MTQDQIERCNALWRKLLAAGRVRWVAGMSTRYEWRVVRVAGSRCLAVPHDGGMAVWRSAHDWLPVWTDPATIGCLVALVREAAQDPTAYACVVPGALLDGEDRWCIIVPGVRELIQAETEPEALLLAIQAATA